MRYESVYVIFLCLLYLDNISKIVDKRVIGEISLNEKKVKLRCFFGEQTLQEI